MESIRYPSRSNVALRAVPKDCAFFETKGWLVAAIENALPALCPQCKVLYVGKNSFPLPHFPHFVTHYADSMPICIFYMDFGHLRITLFCCVAASACVA